jgi:hypothetical protein
METINKLDHFEIEKILAMAKDNVDEVALSLINDRGDTLTSSDVLSILEITKDKHRIIEALIQKKGASLTPNEIVYFSWYDRKNLEWLKTLLSNYFDEDVINKNAQNWENLDAHYTNQKYHIRESILRINIRKFLNEIWQ